MEKQAQNQTANQTAGGLGSSIASGLAGGATQIPAGMELIVAWIIKQVNMKVAQINIPQYLNASGVNITGGAVSVIPAPSGGAVPAVGLIAPAALFSTG